MASKNSNSEHFYRSPHSIRSMGTFFKASQFLANYSLSLLDNLTASRGSKINETVGVENLTASKPILIYLHYSKQGTPTQREIQTLQELRLTGLQVLLVINSDNQNLEMVKNDYADALIYRKNIGWDLAGYRDAFLKLKEQKLIRDSPIILMNNSVIWFPEKIREYFLAFLNQKTDIAGASFSHQYRNHIQTFLLGGLTIEGNLEIEKWLAKIKNWSMKRTVVRLGELGTQQILNSQAQCESLPNESSLTESIIRKMNEAYSNPNSKIDYSTIARLRRNRTFLFAGVPLNPSHDYWLEMFENGFPGIKFDLIRNNPSQLADYELAISKLLESGFEYKLFSEIFRSNKSRSIVVRIRMFLKW